MLDASTEVRMAAQQLSKSKMDIPTRMSGQSKVQPIDDVSTKAIELSEGNTGKTALIGARLDPE